MEVIGDILMDFDGFYVCNIENFVYDLIGVYYLFDGDGMLYVMDFCDGCVMYCNCFVCIEGFFVEVEVGYVFWVGLIGNLVKLLWFGWGVWGDMKDVFLMDVVVYVGEVFLMYYMCGEGYCFNFEMMD